jgi:hypothetical protein
MSKMRIDLQNDPEIPAGRELIENLVGAHMVAYDQEELLHLVGVSIHEIYSSTPEKSLRIMTHATYHAQALIVGLLDLATRQSMALENAGVSEAVSVARDSDRYGVERLDLWLRLRDDRL